MSIYRSLLQLSLPLSLHQNGNQINYNRFVKLLVVRLFLNWCKDKPNTVMQEIPIHRQEASIVYITQNIQIVQMITMKMKTKYNNFKNALFHCMQTMCMSQLSHFTLLLSLV